MNGQNYPVFIEKLCKSYKGKRSSRVVAVADLSLTVEPGEILGVLGPNGAGKSTMIKLLTGQLLPDSGSIKVFGRSAADTATRWHIGYLPENPAFYAFLSAREYLSFVGGLYGLAPTDLPTAIGQVLTLLDLKDAADRPLRQFSKGMVQRLGLAQALLHDPDLYILDEPMSGLDPMGRTLVKNLMLELRGRGKTILFSTHVTADVEAVCDRVAVIVSGKLQAINVVNDLLEKGIDGYAIHLTGCPEHLLAGFRHQERSSGAREVYVPCLELNDFLARVAAVRATILLMEPHRRDLEQFFLEIVERQAR